MIQQWSFRSRALGVAGLVLALGAGCGATQKVVDVDTAEGPTRRVIRVVESVEAQGSTTLVTANPNGPGQAAYAPLFDGIAQLSPRVCTATHLGSGVVLTAGHCLEDDPPDDNPQFPEVLDDDRCLARVEGVQEKMTMKWGRLYGRAAYLRSECARIVAWEWTDARDFAVMIISPTNGQLPRVAVPADFAEPARGEEITVFSHPNASALRWSGICKLGVPEGSAMPYFFHGCTTAGGSSGAAMIDAASHKVVGFHLGQWGQAGPNYAMYLSDPGIRAQIDRAFAQVAARGAGAAPALAPAAR